MHKTPDSNMSTSLSTITADRNARPPLRRRGSMPAAMIVPNTAAQHPRMHKRRSSINQNSINKVLTVPLSAENMNIVYSSAGPQSILKSVPINANKSTILKSASITDPKTTNSDDHPLSFSSQINPYTLYFHDEQLESDFRNVSSDNNKKYSIIYLSVSIIVSIASFLYRNFQLQASRLLTVEERIYFPCIFVTLQVLALLSLVLLRDKIRTIVIPWIILGVLYLHTIAGAIIYDMLIISRALLASNSVNAGPIYMLYKSAFLFCISIISSTLLLRIRFIHSTVSSVVLCIMFMTVATNAEVCQLFETVEYINVWVMTLILIMILLWFIYVLEIRDRNSFFQNWASAALIKCTQLSYSNKRTYQSLHPGLDILSPIEKARNLVRDLLANPKLDLLTTTCLSQILQLMQSNNPMLPDFVGISSELNSEVNSKSSSQGQSTRTNISHIGGHALTRAVTIMADGMMDKESEKWMYNEVIPRASQITLPIGPFQTMGIRTPSEQQAHRGHFIRNQSFIDKGLKCFTPDSNNNTPQGSLLAIKRPGSQLAHSLSKNNSPYGTQSRLALKSSTPNNRISVSGGFVVDLEDTNSTQIKSIQCAGHVLDFDKLNVYLDAIDGWNWPIFEFSVAAHNMPLLTLSAKLFTQEKLFESLDIPMDKFLRCVYTIEKGYVPTVPYHNSTHATDVLHGCHVLSQSEAIRDSISGLERAALYFAAIIHDFQHPGYSNVFLIAKSDPKAIMYNDRSVLEQFHASTAFAVMAQPECNFTADWDPAIRRSFRELVIDLVLATDLKMQAEIITQWKTRIDCFDVRLPADRHILLKMIVKASDVANPTKSLLIYREWITRIMTEFFQQGDEERKLGIPISPYCDSTQPNLPGSQVGFMTWLVCPLYEALNLVVPIPIQVGQLRGNLEYWKSVQLQVQTQATSKVYSNTPAEEASDSYTNSDESPRSDECLDVNADQNN